MEGITADVNFTFSSDVYSTRFTIPLVGLYPLRTTQVVYTFTAVDGSTSVQTISYAFDHSNFDGLMTHY